MKIFIVGDTHWGTGDEQKVIDLYVTGKAQKGDIVIICGDAGIVWDDGPEDEKVKTQIAQLPFTIIYALGNHENYNALAKYQLVDFAGAKAHRILDNCYQIENGEFVELDGKSFWFCGGAASTDKALRTINIDWWRQEVPTDKEIEKFYRKISAVGKVDYIISHQCPQWIERELYKWYDYEPHSDRFLTKMFDYIYNEVEFKHWFCAHHHILKHYDGLTILYNDVIEISD